MSIRPLLLFLFLVYANWSVGQSVPHFEFRAFGLFDQDGKIIYPDHKDYQVTFFDGRGKSYASDQIPFNNKKRYVTRFGRWENVLITIRHQGDTMKITTSTGIDSIVFQAGSFVIDNANKALVNNIVVHPVASITNFQPAYLEANTAHQFSTYTYLRIPEISRKKKCRHLYSLRSGTGSIARWEKLGFKYL